MRAMPRAIWRGSIAFGLVSIPVRLYPATSPKDVRFHEVDRRTGRRVRHRRVVEEPEPLPGEAAPLAEEPAEAPVPEPEDPSSAEPPGPEAPEPGPVEREVPAADLVKGYEIAPDLMVHLDPDEVESLKPERTRTIEIENFVGHGSDGSPPGERRCGREAVPPSERPLGEAAIDLAQAISIAGAAMVLGAFAALQFRKVGPLNQVYLVLNVLGSGCLAVAAVIESLWAFVVLNSVWALVSLRSLVQVARGGATPARREHAGR